GAKPTVRAYHAMAYDAARQRVVLFAGDDGGNWLTEHLMADTWLYGDLVPAATRTIGSACAGANGLPLLASGSPWLGNRAFAIALLSARAAARCLFVLATGTQTLQLSGGCALYVKDTLVPIVAVTNASGYSSLQLSVPLDPSLRGAAVYGQALVLDSMGSYA